MLETLPISYNAQLRNVSKGLYMKTLSSVETTMIYFSHITTDKDKAEILNDYPAPDLSDNLGFSSLYTTNNICCVLKHLTSVKQIILRF